MTWRCSDGTEIDLGGVVRGDEPFAESLRDDIRRIAVGLPPPVQLYPPPGGSVELDVNDPVLVDSWVRNEARLLGVEVVDAPDVEYPVSPYSTEGHPEGVEY